MLVQVSNKSTLFGPMQQDPLMIKDKLFQGIDGDYNVTNIEIVMAVIGELENFHITREELETTRLGKHINELRRKASDKQLANRAKCLVKKWRSLLTATMPEKDSGPPPGGGNTGVAGGNTIKANNNNNSSLATNGNTATRLANPYVANVSPRLQGAVRNSVSPAMRVPGSQVQSPRPLPPSVSGGKGPRPPPSPSLQQKANLGSGSRTSPVVISSTSTSPSYSVSRPSSPALQPSQRTPSPEIVAISQRQHTTGHKRGRQGHHLEQEVEIVDLEEEEEQRVKATSHRAHKRPKLELTNGDSRQSESSQDTNASSKKVNSISDNHSLNRPKKSVKRPSTKSDASNILNRQMLMAHKAGKVRTTQELVQNLGIESRAASVSPNNHVTDLVPNENKAELMNRFFSSQREPTLVETASADQTSGDEGSSSEAATPSAGPASRVATPAVPPEGGKDRGDSIDDILAKLPPIDPAAVLAEWEAENEDEEEETEGLIPVFKPKQEITPRLIEDLSEGQLEHIGGIRDHQGEFKEWHELVSLKSKDGELLHILPYSVID